MAQLITPLTEDEAQEALDIARRAKLRQIANEITKARDRGFGEDDKYIPAKGLELARQVDVEHMVNRGLLKRDDKVWMRNWWTGHQEQITVAEYNKAMEDVFWLRQALRQREQDYRNQVEVIYNDEAKTVSQRAQEIQQIVVPPFLDLPEKAVKSVLRVWTRP